MEQLTVANTIVVADLSVSIAANYESDGDLFGKRKATTAPQTIAIVVDALRWQYESIPTTKTIRGVANYLIWLCGQFGLEAQYNIGNGTGASVLPIYTRPIPSPIDFTVANVGSFIVSGQSTMVIPSYKSYNIIFARGGVVQPSTNLGSSYYTWDKTTATFTCYPAAYEGEIFQLTPTI